MRSNVYNTGMNFFESLKNILDREPTKSDVAQDIADRISAMEQQQRCARYDGDVDLLEDATNQILQLRNAALESGLDPNKYPGLFR